MKSFGKRYRHLIALFCVIGLAVGLIGLGAPVAAGLLIVGLFQLSQFAMSKRCGVCFNSALTPEQVKEFSQILDSFKGFDGLFKELMEISKQEGGFAAIKKLPELLKGEQDRSDKLEKELKSLRKQMVNFSSGTGVRWIGGVPFVTDDCAKALSSLVVLECQRATPDGKMLAKLLNSEKKETHEKFLNLSAGNLGMELKAALTTADIPVPTVYVPQIVELVWHYGQARQFGTVYPLGGGQNKLPRLRAGEDDFGFVGGAGYAAMSQALTERKAELDLVTFTPNKAGGLIRIPTELEEDTFVQLGQFLARYIARQMAKLEDKTMFLADGSNNYVGITGVGPYCIANPTYLRQLGAGNVKVGQATIADFRAMRGLVNPAVLVDDPAYYMNPTLESLLVSFNTLNQPLIYIPAKGGQPATLDGFPIRWVGVMQPNTNDAAPSTFIAMFGSLKYWYLGERLTIRVEVSRDVFFATDELAMRALERIDVEGMAIDAMSALQTAAQ